jgi:ATP-dependent helicase/nuclease subunit B
MTKNIFTIPASLSFSDTLAAGLMKEHENDAASLSHVLILLPTRRGCRVMREAFLRQTNGQPLLLPQLKAIGDIDEEDLVLHHTSHEAMIIPPAISAMKRQMLLMRLVGKLTNFSHSPEQDMALAQALATLMDQIHTENLALSDLPQLVDKESFADHWQITIDFLKILSEHWPLILEQEGCIDPADRRNRLILALAKQWQNSPPSHPVIAAGTTGSIYATKSLLKVISGLPKGRIILPGLDKAMEEGVWNDIAEGHPQATLKNLLESLDVSPKDVQTYGNPDANNHIEAIMSDVMLPANHTNKWGHSSILDQAVIQSSLSNITRYDCANSQHEADLIAVIMREALEEPNKTAALITPDRTLARRVAKSCEKWGITLDDSAGQNLTENTLGKFLLSIPNAFVNNLKPYAFFSLLKNTYIQEGQFPHFRQTVRFLEKHIRRHTLKISEFEDYKKIKEKTLASFINYLDSILPPDIDKFYEGHHSFAALLSNHLKIAETLSSSNVLWQGDDGEATAQFFSDLKTYASSFPDMTGHDYHAILKRLMAQVTIRPKFGTHPRLQILGQLEARLVQADRVILAGLNEGTWPPAISHDPWMSRPMREAFGLPPAERSVTLAAHDFVQGICQKEVFLTRSVTLDGAPKIPARWLERLDTYSKAKNLTQTRLGNGSHLDYVEQLCRAQETKPSERPAPKPPISARPKKLSVTRIETLIKDPYAIYASKILNLYALDPLEKKSDAAEKGNILHNSLHSFVTHYPDILPDDALSDFLTIANEEIKKQQQDEDTYAFYYPRLVRLGEWLIAHEQKWRQEAKFKAGEIKGEIKLGNFTLEGRADRIDQYNDGNFAIIDYKSGGTYSLKQMKNGGLPQLPLEALILNEGGFSFDGTTCTLGYWKLTGGNPPGEIIALSGCADITRLVENTKASLVTLIDNFNEEDTPYYAIPALDNAPHYNDYDYLERVKEWAALDGESEAA